MKPFFDLHIIDASFETIDDKAFHVSSVQVFYSAQTFSCSAK